MVLGLGVKNKRTRHGTRVTENRIRKTAFQEISSMQRVRPGTQESGGIEDTVLYESGFH